MKPIETPRIPFRNLLKEKEFWILIGLGILYFYRPLFFRETFYFRDLYLLYYPQRVHLHDFLKAGKLPLWDPYLNGGQPFLGEIANSALYPSQWLYFLLPTLLAFNVEIVSNVLLAGAGMYLLARVLKLSPVASLIAGSAYAFCGYTLSFINLYSRLMAIPHLPFLLLLWHLFLLERKKRWFLAALCFGVIQFLSGALEMVLISHVTLLLWALVYPYREVSQARRIVLWCLLGFFIVGLCSVQSFPAAEVMQQASRGAGYGYASFGAWSLNPKRLPEMFIPGFFGYTNRLSAHDYWGAKIEGMQFPYVLSIYFGLLIIVLSVAAIRRKENDLLSFRVRVFLLALAALSIVLSFGRFLPLFELVYSHVQWIHRFRYPIKFLGAGVLPVALLAGCGSEVLFEADTRSRLVIGFWCISALLILLSVPFVLSDLFANSFLDFYFGVTGDPARSGLKDALLQSAAIFLLATLLLQFHRLKPRSSNHFILAGIIILDLLLAGRTAVDYAPGDFFTRVPNLVQTVHREIGNGRFLRMPNPPGIVFQVPANNAFYLDRWNLETLYNYCGAFYSIPLIFHEDYDGQANRRIVKLVELNSALPWERRLPLLSAGSIRLILTADQIRIPGLQEVAAVHNLSNRVFHLYRNEKSAPRAVFVSSWTGVNSDEEVLRNLTDPAFDPRQSVIIKAREASSSSQPCTPAQIANAESATTHSTYAVKSDCDGYLVFSEPLDSGWHVKIDGKPAIQTPANYAFSAVFLRAGTHHVERYYLPASFLWGVLVSLIFAVSLATVLRIRWFKERLWLCK